MNHYMIRSSAVMAAAGSSPLQELFDMGMDRKTRFTAPRIGVWINLGAGNKEIFGAEPVDAPDWWAGEEIPYLDSEIDAIFATHFFEHLTYDEIVKVLAECQRVLKDGGSLYTVTPWWRSECANQDPTHKSFWTESTWKNLFNNPYYTRPGAPEVEWQFVPTFTMIMGLVERNLVIVSQLVKHRDEQTRSQLTWSSS